jgi:hypothetical protein
MVRLKVYKFCLFIDFNMALKYVDSYKLEEVYGRLPGHKD